MRHLPRATFFVFYLCCRYEYLNSYYIGFFGNTYFHVLKPGRRQIFLPGTGVRRDACVSVPVPSSRFLNDMLSIKIWFMFSREGMAMFLSGKKFSPADGINRELCLIFMHGKT